MITGINACRPSFGILTPEAKEKAKNWAGENTERERIITETDALPNITVDYIDGLFTLTLHNDNKEKDEDSGACRFFDYASMRAREAQNAYNIIKCRSEIVNCIDKDEK